MRYALLAGLPCLAPVGEQAPSFTGLKFGGGRRGRRGCGGGYPVELSPTWRGWWGRMVGGSDPEWGGGWDVK